MSKPVSWISATAEKSVLMTAKESVHTHTCTNAHTHTNTLVFASLSTMRSLSHKFCANYLNKEILTSSYLVKCVCSKTAHDFAIHIKHSDTHANAHTHTVICIPMTITSL